MKNSASAHASATPPPILIALLSAAADCLPANADSTTYAVDMPYGSSTADELMSHGIQKYALASAPSFAVTISGSNQVTPVESIALTYSAETKENSLVRDGT